MTHWLCCVQHSSRQMMIKVTNVILVGSRLRGYKELHNTHTCSSPGSYKLIIRILAFSVKPVSKRFSCLCLHESVQKLEISLQFDFMKNADLIIANIKSHLSVEINA